MTRRPTHAPRHKADPLPASEAGRDYEAEVIAALARSSVNWPRLSRALAPLVEDLSLGIAATAADALVTNADAAADLKWTLEAPPSNQPAGPMAPEVLLDLLKERHGPLVKRQAELIAAAGRFHAKHATIEDEETQGKSAEFIRQIQAAVKAQKAAHALEKKPWLDLAATVQGFFAKLWDALETEKGKVEAKQLAFARLLRDRATAVAKAEQERLQREADAAAEKAAASMDGDALDEAARRAQQAAEGAAAMPIRAPDLTRVRGDYGATTSMKVRWKIRAAVDWMEKMPRQYLAPDQAALDAALKRAPRGADGTPELTIPGAEVYPDEGMTNRG